jgi:hypothetical protein
MDCRRGRHIACAATARHLFRLFLFFGLVIRELERGRLRRGEAMQDDRAAADF